MTRTMTRIEICAGAHVDEMEAHVNMALERLEAEGFGIKQMVDMSSAHGYAIIIVYGHGPTSTQRWSGGTLG